MEHSWPMSSILCPCQTLPIHHFMFLPTHPHAGGQVPNDLRWWWQPYFKFSKCAVYLWISPAPIPNTDTTNPPGHTVPVSPERASDMLYPGLWAVANDPF